MTLHLVIVGDALLDIDAVGRTQRLCPDAPVPVVEDIVEHARPGGAALAALMAHRDGHHVSFVTAWGADAAGTRLAELLDGIDVERLPSDGPTPVKYRVRSGGQSLLRLDHGSAASTYGAVPSRVAELLDSCSVVLVSDYGRGITSVPGLRDMLQDRPLGTPLVWDPHPRGSDPITHTHLFTPNLTEAAAWADRFDLPQDAPVSTLGAVNAQASGLVRVLGVRAVAVTMSARGALLSYGHGSPVMTPAPPIVALDSCGAGDRFAVTAATALGAGRIPPDAVQEAVLSASSFVARDGAAGLATVDVPAHPHDGHLATNGADSTDAVTQVRARGGIVVATGGCFDLLHAGHIATLRAARSLGDCLVVCVNSDDSVARLKGPSRPLVPQQDRVRVLEALECVDAVMVFGEDTPVRALQELRPDVWVKGGDYAGTEVPEADALACWGGQTVVVPYLPGRSTTRLAEIAALTVPAATDI